MKNTIRNTWLPMLGLIVGSAICAPSILAEGADPQRFSSPDEAAAALLKAAESGDPGAFSSLFGAGHENLLSSGDAVEDKNNREAFAAMAREKLSTEKVGDDKAILHAGNDGWPFPIPVVKRGNDWQFDAAQGEEEIVDRRIGRNELRTLNAMKGYLEAQAEYAQADRDGDGVFEYAQRLASRPGQTDGLFWEPEPGQPESPLGPLFADARAEGYVLKGNPEKPTPYHGYYYRILTRQGSSAPGGKYDYVINGNMIAGFGLVAFPADYGNSGIMTFIVNHQGKIYEKDLGARTAGIAGSMKEFNPVSGWEPVEATQMP